jgi:hypothetical protein
MPLLVVQAFRQIERRNADGRQCLAGLDGQLRVGIVDNDKRPTRRSSELSDFTGRQHLSTRRKKETWEFSTSSGDGADHV